VTGSSLGIRRGECSKTAVMGMVVLCRPGAGRGPFPGGGVFFGTTAEEELTQAEGVPVEVTVDVLVTGVDQGGRPHAGHRDRPPARRR